jgi:DNA-directed RNA polymerase sigma subunit (sigma70/sigma32)|tara:strand:- start:210 stop:452 length:243 start_codon:yes stop_codon:yes gene_type:complete
MRMCMIECINEEKNCKNKECRQWIDYEDDHNCTLIAVEKHGNMTLREISDRLGVSFVRIKQIEDKLVQKLSKKALMKTIR